MLRRAGDIALILAGTIFVGVGGLLWSIQRPIPGGVVTSGVIVDQVVTTDSEGEKSTYPVIEFTDQFEQRHRFQSKIGGSGFGIEGDIGQTVEVRYDPENPSRAQWADQPGQWIPPTATGVGVVLLLVELGLVARRLVRRRSADTRPRADEPVVKDEAANTT